MKEKCANEGNFPHFLPLKEGGEENSPHLHNSLSFFTLMSHEASQSAGDVIADVMVSFIRSCNNVGECCTAKILHFVFSDLKINLPDLT